MSPNLWLYSNMCRTYFENRLFLAWSLQRILMSQSQKHYTMSFELWPERSKKNIPSFVILICKNLKLTRFLEATKSKEKNILKREREEDFFKKTLWVGHSDWLATLKLHLYITNYVTELPKKCSAYFGVYQNICLLIGKLYIYVCFLQWRKLLKFFQRTEKKPFLKFWENIFLP